MIKQHFCISCVYCKLGKLPLVVGYLSFTNLVASTSYGQLFRCPCVSGYEGFQYSKHFTKYNRFSAAHFLWRHDATFTQKLVDKDMEARHVYCFHDNRWHGSKISIKMKECKDEKQSPCQTGKEKTWHTTWVISKTWMETRVLSCTLIAFNTLAKIPPVSRCIQFR